MTVPAERVRRRPAGRSRAVPLLLVLALLVPVSLLFAQNRAITADARDLAVRERLGVEYLRALGPVTDALVDAQSAAVAGRPVSRDALDRAVEAAASVDARIGDELRSHERWAGLRAKLEALPDRGLTDPQAAFTAYGEVTDLLLALHRKVGESSGLVRDPQADSFYLQNAAAEELPEAVVAAGRLADLAVLAGSRPAAERARSAGELAALRVAALAPAGDLVDDLRAAVDSTESTDLGPNVLTVLDTYQRSVEALALLSAPTTPAAAGQAGPGQIAAARFNSQAAAKQLQPVILTELDVLLKERIDDLDADRRIAAGTAATAVLLLLTLLVILLRAAWRARHAAVAATAGPADDADREPPAGPGAAPPSTRGALQPVGPARDGESATWGPFDAAR